MDSEPGRSIILWTVRCSVAFYAWAVLLKTGVAVKGPGFRLSWTISWLFCIVHVICAYHFEHHWDQSAARQHTAEMTQRVVGIFWSGGLYVNYVFLTLWGADVAWWWHKQRSVFGSSQIAMHAIAGFMMFNATAVFGPSWWIGVVIAYLLLLVVVWNQRRIHPI